jgi:hypothetical protein
MQGGVVEATSTMPQLVAWSTCEVEYCLGALAAMAAFYTRKVYNELHCIDPDYQQSTRQPPIKRPKGPDIFPAGSTSSESRSHPLK